AGQLLLGEAGDAAGLFERCQSVSSPRWNRIILAVAPAAPVEPEARDLRGDRRRNELVDGLPAADARPDLARGDVERLDLEELDLVGPVKLGEHAVEPFARVTRPRRDAEARQLEHAVGIFPAEEVAELVGADEEKGVVEAPLAEHVDGPRVLVGLDFVVREREACQAEPLSGGSRDGLVPRMGHDEHDEPAQVEVLARAADDLEVPVVRRVEDAAEEAGHRYSNDSSPITTSSPSRAPAARSASASASSAGGRPTTRYPRSVRRIRNDGRRGFGR